MNDFIFLDFTPECVLFLVCGLDYTCMTCLSKVPVSFPEVFVPSCICILHTHHRTFSSKADLFFVFAFSLMVVFKLRFVFYSGRCNDGVINVWVWVSKGVMGRTRDHSLLEMESH